MEADPAGVLPGPADAGKGQLHRRGRRLEGQGCAAKALQQQAADAEPEGIATGQNHRPLTCRSGSFELGESGFWLVRGRQGGAGLPDFHPPGSLFQFPPGGQLSEQPFRRRHQVGLGQQGQGRRRQGRQPARIGADHRNRWCHALGLGIGTAAGQGVVCHWPHDGQSPTLLLAP